MRQVTALLVFVGLATGCGGGADDLAGASSTNETTTVATTVTPAAAATSPTEVTEPAEAGSVASGSDLAPATARLSIGDATWFFTFEGLPGAICLPQNEGGVLVAAGFSTDSSGQLDADPAEVEFTIYPPDFDLQGAQSSLIKFHSPADGLRWNTATVTMIEELSETVPEIQQAVFTSWQLGDGWAVGEAVFYDEDSLTDAELGSGELALSTGEFEVNCSS